MFPKEEMPRHIDTNSTKFDEVVEDKFRHPLNSLNRLVFGNDSSRERIRSRIANQIALHNEAENEFYIINAQAMKAAAEIMADSVLSPGSVSLLINDSVEIFNASNDKMLQVLKTDRRLPKKLQGHS